MMRRAAKVDRNQAEIVQALRKAGATVQSLAAIGKGCPDLLVGHNGRNLLLEVKDGDLSPSRRKLTADEREWVGGWKGRAHVVESVEEALAYLNWRIEAA